MSEEIIDYEIRQDTLDDGTAIFDVYAQYVGDSEYLDSFYSKEDAEKYIERMKL